MFVDAPLSPVMRRAGLAAVAALGATYLLSALLVSAFPIGMWYPVKSTALFAVVCVAAATGFHDHPFDTVGSANIVTLVRAALVALTAALVGEPASVTIAWLAAVLASICTGLDGIDGWLARRTGLASEFGARFDMEVDALLIMSLAGVAWWWEKAGVWILLAGAMRYMFVFAGCVWNWMRAALPVSMRRKAVCIVQIVGLAAVVSPVFSGVASAGIALGTLAALTWSFGIDVLWLKRHAV